MSERTSGGPLSARTSSAPRRAVLKGIATTVSAVGAWSLIQTPAMAEQPALTEIAHGRLRGVWDRGIASFKGIPYAGKVSSEHRFRRAPAVEPWTGVKAATAFGPSCYQEIRGTGPNDVSAADMSEDCLQINVWTPSLGSSRKAAVMIFIHPGGFAGESATLRPYDGANLARHGDVVVVSLNHRLNIFGYTHFHTIDASYAGNVGQLDLVLGLEWVRNNIAAFGGDAANVTVFGESGGGQKISTLMGMPAAKGLFHKAIISSGSYLSVATHETAERTARSVLKALDIAPSSIGAIHKVSAERLIAAYSQIARGVRADTLNAPFSPAIDSASIPQQTWSPEAPAYSADIPLLVGTTRHEAAFFLGRDTILNPPPTDADMANSILRGTVARSPLTQSQILSMIDRYRRIHPAMSRPELMVRIATDLGMHGHAVAQAERKIAGGPTPVFVYEFEWRVPSAGGHWAVHASDIPFFLDNVDSDVGSFGPEDTPAARAAADPGRMAPALGARMSGAWASFARTGKPFAPGLPHWPAYTLARRDTMIFDKVCAVVSDPHADERNIYRDLITS